MSQTLANAGEAILDVRGLRKEFRARGRDDLVAIGDVTFTQRRGEFLALVGPSGCGKSTLLRCLTHLAAPTSGVVRFDGAPIDAVPEGLALVFQEYTRSLYPWLSVHDNVAFGLNRLGKTDRQGRVEDALAQVHLEEFADHYPWQLSGGMQQRVAIARAMASRPKVLLMDEPFASVDAQTRASLESMVLDLWHANGFSATLVTHDIDEAVFMADRVLVLSGRPSTILDDIVINLPRPRDHLETRELPEFRDCRRRIIEMIQNMPR